MHTSQRYAQASHLRQQRKRAEERAARERAKFPPAKPLNEIKDASCSCGSWLCLGNCTDRSR